jgi:hypothetical protein
MSGLLHLGINFQNDFKTKLVNQKCEAFYSVLISSSAEVGNVWIFTSTPSIRFDDVFNGKELIILFQKKISTFDST